MENLTLPRPTVRWRAQFDADEGAGGAGFFSHEAIHESDKLLDSYLFALEKAIGEEQIWQAIKKVVTGFDALNVDYEYFIETDERKELAAYIQKAAEAAGLKYEGDVTEKWRMEW
ncbi:MAG: hypothetical protein K0R51_1556 [Cytophagaceae bacterium]|jgi:hypothetical protein|nr:hypothetical protein [Cytophagaceae bacterium]